MTLDPGHCSPPRSPHHTPQTAETSRFTSGRRPGRRQGSKPQEPQLRDDWWGWLWENAGKERRRGRGPGRGLPAGQRRHRPSSRNGYTPPPGSGCPLSRLESPGLTRAVLGHGPLLPLPTQQWQVMRRLGSRDAQADCLPQATVSSSRPLPPRGSRSPDQRSRKRRTMQNDTEGGTGRGGRESSSSPERLAEGGEDAGGATARGEDGQKASLPSSLLAEGPTRASGSPHIRVSGDSCVCRLSRGADTPNFRRRWRRLARQMGVTCDRLGRACATLLFSRHRLS